VAKQKGSKGDGNPVLASNRSASHEYHLVRRLEAGIVLTGPEVKTARAGKVNLKEAYCRVRNGEVFLVGAHFSPYLQATHDAEDPVRSRKLLLHATEIRKLERDTQDGGMTIVPTRLYLKGGRIKVEIALAKGKKLWDKRDSIKRRELDREMDRGRSRDR